MLFHKNKCIVIAGCGPLGAALAKSLYKKGHKVVVLDKDRESFRYLPEEFRGYEMEGDPTDPQVLKAAGIEDAGLFIASTQDDNTNLLLAQIASRIFHVSQVYARLDEYFDLITPLDKLENEISRCILSETEVADDASAGLRNIRREIKASNERVKDHLNGVINSSAYRNMLQDFVITIRNDRYCVPVKAEYRSSFPGMIHDQSNTGSTLFMEPLSVIQLNNKIKELQAKEKEEIEKILIALSDMVTANAFAIEGNLELLTQLDFIFAKANLSLAMDGTQPLFNTKGYINIHKGRHPLLDPKKVVPTDIYLGKDFTTLMITGPNTGGKTVALKTLGLFTLMGQAGLHIPAFDNSQLAVFDNVFASIGDEQSIEQSLSTFSAHMTNIVKIMDEVTDDSLVLFDELGAGTDPTEGAALAVAIIQALLDRKIRTAVTTHYSELKVFALTTEGVENACCEFDVQTLRPTYRLLIGVPGRSNAFAISKRLGIEDSIIQRAKELVSAENTKFEDVVRSLEETRQKLEEEKAQAEALRLQAVKLNESAQEQKKRIEANAAKEIEIARRQASNLVARTRAQIDALTEEMDQLRKQKSLTPEQKAKLNQGIRSLEDMADPVHKKEKEDYVLPRPLKIGDTVLIFDIDKQATVIGLPKNSDQVEVQAGIMKTRVPLSNLRLMQQEKVKTPQPISRRGARTDRAHAKVVRELDIRGQTAMEALLDVDNFIDAAVMAGVHQLSIIHGKGTGVLRAAVQQHLKKHPSVKSYRLGVFGEGESGVTIVELK